MVCSGGSCFRRVAGPAFCRNRPARCTLSSRTMTLRGRNTRCHVTAAPSVSTEAGVGPYDIIDRLSAGPRLGRHASALLSDWGFASTLDAPLSVDICIADGRSRACSGYHCHFRHRFSDASRFALHPPSCSWPAVASRQTPRSTPPGLVSPAVLVPLVFPCSGSLHIVMTGLSASCLPYVVLRRYSCMPSALLPHKMWCQSTGLVSTGVHLRRRRCYAEDEYCL